MKMGAASDPTGLYRYSLWREWNPDAARLGFVMLNPNRADASVDDPTIRRCIGFARSWGYGSLEVVNLFAYRTAHPKMLCQVVNPIGIENDDYLESLAHRVDRIILAWGNWGALQGRDRAVLSLLTNQESRLCLGMTKLGHPRHPLYLRGDTLPIPFSTNQASNSVQNWREE
ncbi:MAG: DUF1643 domain-containing protein [Leptolyngbyaceae cyanobacterium RU_5_1]|nr:DUF1643 domain-containing protein [Leptolyngbyaceae cyanobacterium RU_5_1]